MTMTNISFDAFASLEPCRICLEPSKKSKYVTDFLVEGTIIFDIINQVTGLTITAGDSYPQTLCLKCFDELRTCFEFKDKALKSDQILKSGEVQIKEEFDENDFESFDNMVESIPGIEVNMIEYKEDVDLFTGDIKPTTKTNKTSSNSTRRKRNRTSKYPIIRCCMCGLDFESDSDLEKHAESEHPFGAPQERQITSLHAFECKLCKRKYWKKKYLIDHYKDINYIEPKRLNTQNIEKKRIMCSDCGKLFPCKVDLEVHIANVHNTTRDVECEQCGKKFTHEKCLSRHKFRVHSDILYTCDVCSKQFRDKCLLKSHVAVHVDKKRFQCKHCPKSFSLKYAFDNHVVVEHTEAKRPHACDQCDKTYRWLSDLKKHIRADHLGMPPCSCLYCGRGFTSSSSKNYHQKRCQMNPVPFNGTTGSKALPTNAFNLL